VLTQVSGPEGRCPGAEPDELIGVLRRWAAIQSWAAAGMLGVIRQLIREDDLPALNRPRHGDLPDEWSDTVTHELALALASSVVSAEKTTLLAWELGARLPGIALLLANGTLTQPKAGLIAEAFQFLSDQDAARAEALLIPQLTGTTGKTYGQLINLTARIAAQVDPSMAERRRKAAEKHAARVTLFRENSGAAGLSGRDLPADETLAAYANVNARAEEYKESGAFGDARMDQLRSTAYLDLLNGVPAWERIAHGQLIADEPDTAADPSPGTGGTGADGSGSNGPGSSGGHDPDDPGCDGAGTGAEPMGPRPGTGGNGADDHDIVSDRPDPDNPGGDVAGTGAEPVSPRPGTGGNGVGDRNIVADRAEEDDNRVCGCSCGECDGGCVLPDGQDDGGRQPEPAPSARRTARPRLPDLIFPLVTLLGLADRPGEGHGFGVFDPDLCRQLAAIATRSPHTTLCITVTDPDGIALGHGCARPGKLTGTLPGVPGTSGPPGGLPALVALPARINLTITAELLSALLRGIPAIPARSSPQRATGWALAPPGTTSQGAPCDPGWSGTWTLTVPGGTELALVLGPVPTLECDHRHESHGYQPNDTLRHLVQVRDYTCTFPSCSRHARESDFEHGRPYHKGGRTCACNAGARSRKCHRVKQSPGWNVTQPRPGWHEWRTPAGLTYTQGPHPYPV
jgi:hypothetical protein